MWYSIINQHFELIKKKHINNDICLPWFLVFFIIHFSLKWSLISLKKKTYNTKFNDIYNKNKIIIIILPREHQISKCFVCVREKINKEKNDLASMTLFSLPTLQFPSLVFFSLTTISLSFFPVSLLLSRMHQVI